MATNVSNFNRVDYIYMKQRQYNDHKHRDESAERRSKTLPAARRHPSPQNVRTTKEKLPKPETM